MPDPYEEYLDFMERQTRQGGTSGDLRSLVNQLLYESKLRKLHNYENIARQGGLSTSPQALGVNYDNVTVNARIADQLEMMRLKRELGQAPYYVKAGGKTYGLMQGLEQQAVDDAARADLNKYKLNEVIARLTGAPENYIVERPALEGSNVPRFTNVGPQGQQLAKAAGRRAITGPVDDDVYAQLATTADFPEHQQTVQQLASAQGAAELAARVEQSRILVNSRLKPDYHNASWDKLPADAQLKELNYLLKQADDGGGGVDWTSEKFIIALGNSLNRFNAHVALRAQLLRMGVPQDILDVASMRVLGIEPPGTDEVDELINSTR